MNWKSIGKALLFPPLPLCLFLLVLSAGALVYTLTQLADTDPIRILSYVAAFYTLVIWCTRMPGIIRSLLHFRRENKYARRWLGDARLRINVTLSGNVLWNGAYAAIQLGLGIYHKSAWFYSLAAYYASLAVMRSFLVRYTLHHQPGEQMRRELKHYRTCGWIFLWMNLALSGMMFHMIYENRTMRHHEITTIAMAAYTFTSLTMAIINVIKYRKYKSPVFSASKAISLASACVSMLTLENIMLTTFRDNAMTARTQGLFLALSGGAISIFIVIMAIYMIAHSSQKLKHMET